MVIAESMAMGLPVVAGESSGAVPWVVGEHGGLCDVRNPGTIMRALVETLEPDQYAQLSREAITSTQARFSTAHVVDQFYSLYEQALEQHSMLTEQLGKSRSAAW